MAARKYPTLNKCNYTLKERGDSMENKFIRVDEVAKELDVSKPYAYKLIRQLNEELKAKGFITIAGRVNRQYFNERLYGAERNDVNAGI
jgi:predicted transcriptional regulator